MALSLEYVHLQVFGISLNAHAWRFWLYRKYAFQVTNRLQNALLKISCQVVRMTTSENAISDDLGTTWYHQSKVPGGRGARNFSNKAFAGFGL